MCADSENLDREEAKTMVFVASPVVKADTVRNSDNLDVK